MSGINARWITRACTTIMISGLCVLMALVSGSTASAQLLEPPLGWDIWNPTWPDSDLWDSDDQDEALRWRMQRHQAYIDHGVPAPYRQMQNVLPRIPSVLEAGQALYVTRCASCHDEGGQGRGEAGLSLYPSPALLVHLVRLPSRVDEYLFWTIAEGGKAFGTAMPAFKDVLDDEQIWQVITYMRAGFPNTGGAGKE